MSGQSTAIIPVAGVLRKSSDGGPIGAGLKLYRALASTFNIVLVGETEHDDAGYQKSLEHWLMLHGLTNHSHVHYIPGYLEEQLGRFGARVLTLRSLRRDGFMLDVVIEPDPALAAELMQDGWTVLAFLHPAYARPEWRPDHQEEVVPWEELVARVRNDQLVKARDQRTSDDDDNS